MKQLAVGSGRPLKTLQAGILAAAEGDTLLLDAPETFSLGSATQAISKSLTIRSANDQRPTVSFSGAHNSAAILIAEHKILTLQNIDFAISRGSFVASCRGGLQAVNSNVKGGGAVLAQGCTDLVSCTNWTIEDQNNNYVWYHGPLTTVHDATHFQQRMGAGLSLQNCSAVKGVTADHVCRIHGAKQVNIDSCKFATQLFCALRLHDGGDAVVTNSSFNGDVTFGPMDGGDSGIHLPLGPQRSYYEALRLNSLMVDNCQLICNDFAICAGILNGSIDRSLISDHIGGAVVNSRPFWTRPLSTVSFNKVAFVYLPSGGRVFSDENGAKNMRCIDCGFQGKTFTH